ncbi:MAG: hypothetical protein U5K81_09230 [Trueperaceae bacterium]|nr:hypothetical protein [Trueperaceae bacterium]
MRVAAEAEAPAVIEAAWAEAAGAPGSVPAFDRMVALRSLAVRHGDEAYLRAVRGLAAPEGVAAFVDPLPAQGTRLVDVLPAEGVSSEAREAVRAAEEEAYRHSEDPRFRFAPEAGVAALRAAGWAVHRAETVDLEETRVFPARALDRWFAAGAPFRERLAAHGLDDAGVAAVERPLRAALQEREVSWRTRWSIITAGPAADDEAD